MTDATYQAIKKSETERMEREIFNAVDRQFYDMRHPYWREKLRDYMEKAGKPKPIQTSITINKQGT